MDDQILGDFVTVVNRSSQPLTATFNGRQYVLKPGPNAYPMAIALKARAQNPVMGTEHPLNPLKFKSLVGIKELGDPIDPIEQSAAVERINRDQLPQTLRGHVETSVIAGIDRYMVSGDGSGIDASFVQDRGN